MPTQINQRRISRYQEISNRLTVQIDSGVFQPDERLPSVRSMMRSENISMTTATRVFQELEASGHAYARKRSGYFVRTRRSDKTWTGHPAGPVGTPFEAVNVEVNHLVVQLLSDSAKEHVLSLGSAVLDGPLVPKSLLNRVLMSIIKEGGMDHASYVAPPGLFELRCRIARIMNQRGVLCGPDEIMITAGDSIAIELALRAATKHGDSVAIESPTYFGILQAIETSGLKAVEITTDPEKGIDIEALGRAVQMRRISCVLLNPTFHNPLGYTMSNERRKALVELLASEQIPLIEDDVYYDLYSGAVAPTSIKAYDRQGMVLYCSSFSKVLVPGYRIGWCLPGRYYKKMMYETLSRNISISSLPQLTLSEFLRKGYYERHVAQLRTLFSAYPAKVTALIGLHFPTGTRVSQPQGGFVFWVELPTPINMPKFCEAALAENISITPGTIFFASGTSDTAFRICVGRRWNSRVEQAIARLGHLCHKLLESD